MIVERAAKRAVALHLGTRAQDALIAALGSGAMSSERRASSAPQRAATAVRRRSPCQKRQHRGRERKERGGDHGAENEPREDIARVVGADVDARVVSPRRRRRSKRSARRLQNCRRLDRRASLTKCSV